MWELNKGSWYKWETENKEGYELVAKDGIAEDIHWGNRHELVASLINHGPHDDINLNKWGVQIHPADGGLVVIGYIHQDAFDSISAQAIADAALHENKDYEWWVANATEWFMKNTVSA